MEKQFGAPLIDWRPPPRPGAQPLIGRYSVLEPLQPATHGPALAASYANSDAVWDYLPYGPFESDAQYVTWLNCVAGQADPFFYAVKNLHTGTYEGVLSYLRIAPQDGSIEVGHINLSPALQRTRAATEALYLTIRWAFDSGYRRFEWKCDALNVPSRRAAQRLGLSYEGIFRQATHYKERNRDTAWFAAIDSEWPRLRAAFETWLAPDNFDASGHQRQRLADLTAPIRAASDPLPDKTAPACR